MHKYTIEISTLIQRTLRKMLVKNDLSQLNVSASLPRHTRKRQGLTVSLEASVYILLHTLMALAQVKLLEQLLARTYAASVKDVEFAKRLREYQT